MSSKWYLDTYQGSAHRVGFFEGCAEEHAPGVSMSDKRKATGASAELHGSQYDIRVT
jgi:hypothetical protein